LPEPILVNRMRNRARPWTVCSAVVGVCLAAAARPGMEPVVTQSPTSPTVTAESRSTDTVRVGCFGGHAALSSGNVLTREGALSRYEKQLQTPATYTFLRRDSVAAALVFAELERIRFRTLRFNEISNMTCFLKLSDSNEKHELTWLLGRPPAVLKPALAALTRTFGDHSAMWAQGI
jgi:hypothetical protein